MAGRFIMMIALFSLLVSGCASLPSAAKPELADEGEIFVYLDPLPQEAERLKFTIDRVAAVGSDGSEFPLSLVLREIHSGTVTRQRFIAAGRLPPGQYSGLSFTAVRATLSGEERDAELLLPGGPVTKDFPFTLERKQSLVLSLVFRYEEAMQNGFSFTPSFSVYTPTLPAAGLVGYVANRDDNTVTVFDKKSGQVMGVIATGRGPDSIALDQKTGRAYVSLSREDAIEEIDLTQGGVIGKINLNMGDDPGELALTSDGKVLLVVNSGSRTLGIVDPIRRIETGRVPVGDGPRTLLVDRSGNRCYVFNTFSDTLSVVDIRNRALVGSVSTEARPLRGQFNSRGDKLYVIHEGNPYLSIVDPFSLSVVQRVFAGPGIGAIKVDSATDTIYLFREGEGRVELYDAQSLLFGSLVPYDSIMAMSGVVRMAIDREENRLYLLSSQNKLLTSISLVSKKIVAETDVGENAAWVTIMGER